MKHFGDITKISGYEVPLVDIICGGSPCQDLSVAGKRAGLDGARSGLFMEQIRIVKEMRDASRRIQTDDDIRHIQPRFLVWENVKGALTSPGKRNGEDLRGEDFRTVLEEIAKIADCNASIPRPAKGKWTNSGAIMGDGWSIAWRLHSAEFWGKTIIDPCGRVVKGGTPQRRYRICLVADFGGDSAPKILFEPKGSRGDSAESREEEQGIAGSVGESIEKAGGTCIDISQEVRVRKHEVDVEGLKALLKAHKKPLQMIADELGCPLTKVEHWFRQDKCFSIPDADLWMKLKEILEIETDAFDKQIMEFEEKECNFDMHNRIWCGDVAPTLIAGSNDLFCVNKPIRAFNISPADSNSMNSNNPYSGIQEVETARTLDVNGGNPACNQGGLMICVDEKGIAYRKTAHPTNSEEGQGWEETQVSDCLNVNDISEARVPNVIVQNGTYQKTAGCLMASGYDKLGTQEAVNDMFVVQKTYQQTTGTLCAMISKGISNQIATEDMLVANDTIVRRLTPCECERLQGFPDHWTDLGDWIDSKGKKHKASDGPRYKALGNSIALPYWQWMAGKMVKELDAEQPTMASLFDGIGGFPLVYSRSGCRPVWASEIEEFGIAVTKKHFGEEQRYGAGEFV